MALITVWCVLLSFLKLAALTATLTKLFYTSGLKELQSTANITVRITLLFNNRKTFKLLKLPPSKKGEKAVIKIEKTKNI